MKKRKVLNMNKIFIMLIMLSLILPVGMASEVMASNWTDTEYYKKYSGNGGDVWLDYRQKQDDSSAYIYHKGNVGVSVSVRVQGYNGIYSGANGMYGGGSYLSAPTGQGFYIVNMVAESFPSAYAAGNYKNITLTLSPNTHSACTLYGVWSPDSI